MASPSGSEAHRIQSRSTAARGFRPRAAVLFFSALAGLIAFTTPATAQVGGVKLPPSSSQFPAAHLDTSAALQQPAADACPGCPPKRIGRAFWQATVINVFYEVANLVRGQDTAKITPKTWWTNMKRGWEWDLDDFAVNQIGHPYQGNNYFNAGRSNGLDFWESAALTAFGSGTWEYFGETNQASLNDFINTTLGGIALGEMFHRLGWLIRDTQATGRGRMWKEIGAMAVDPVTGANRFISGDASRVVEKPADMVPSSLTAITDFGMLWRGSNTADVESDVTPFVEIDLLYGDLERGRSRTPYDAFAVRLDFGGGSAFSEARVRGRLLGQPFRNGALQLSVGQGYQYNKNDAYQFGAQSADVSLGGVKRINDRMSFWLVGWGGVTILGAVDSIPPPGSIVPEEPGEGEGGQGVSTGPRNYDYGPGTNAGAYFNLNRDGRSLITLSYELHHLHVLDGARANHVLQRARADFHFPLKGRLGYGVSGEFFDRRTWYKLPDVPRAIFTFPQVRAFLTWSTS